MRVPQVENGAVVAVYEFGPEDMNWDLLPGLVPGEAANVGDLYDARTATFAPPPPAGGPAAPTIDDLAARYLVAVQAEMDRVARAFGYDDMTAAVTYAEEPAVQRFQAEGQALRAWRSLVWDACYAMLAAVRAGDVAVPTEAEVLAALPAAPAQEQPLIAAAANA